MGTSATDRITRCRYLGRFQQCTGEAVDLNGEILLCTKHLARALEMLKRRTVRVPVGGN